MLIVAGPDTTPDALASQAYSLANNNPGTVLIVGFSLYIWNRAFLDETARIMRKRSPHAILVAGGPEASADSLGLSDSGLYDAIIKGEGESAIIEFVAEILERKTGYKLPTLRPTKTCIISGTPEDLSTLPSPWEDGTLDCSTTESAVWELARGCPFRCAYCYESLGQKTVRHLSTEQLKKQLSWFSQNGVCQISILDPTFNIDKKRAIEILSYLRSKTPDIHYDFEIRAEFLDKAQAHAFSALDCSLQLGLQSSDPKVLAGIDRLFDPDDFRRKVNLLNNESVVFGFDLIYGLPGDSLDGFYKSLDFALKLRPNHLDIFRLAVLPGTSLGLNAAELGICYDSQPPYLVTSAPGWTEDSLLEAEKIARTTYLLYSYGRAVSWFEPTCNALHTKPSSILKAAVTTMPKKFDTFDPQRSELETWQENFMVELCKASYPESALALQDLIRFNAAWSKAVEDGQTTDIELHYPVDFVASTDNPVMLAQSGKARTSKIKVFLGPNGNVHYTAIRAKTEHKAADRRKPKP